MFEAEGRVNQIPFQFACHTTEYISGHRMLSFYLYLGYQGEATLPGKRLTISVYRLAVAILDEKLT
jgi:hypothetical protein